MNNTAHLGRKLDDSLPDFVTFVVSRFWKWEKRGGNQQITVLIRG
jgi:predicted amidophosphoribosyltransferase